MSTPTKHTRQYRAAVIGHTGRGNYGHGLDIVFNDLPMVKVVAVADPDPTGRAKTQAATGAPAAYADYREMLERERPDLVTIAPRWVDNRLPMVEAAAAVGAHMYVEKPLAYSLVEADAMLEACKRAGVKMAVAHQSRLHPAVLHAVKLVEEGNIGRLRLIRGYGKMDHRGGGQDLAILGTHVLDQMRLFGGNAQWAAAEIMAGSRLTTDADVRAGQEEIAPIAGDGLRATYGFENGVIGIFESFVGLGSGEGLFGLELVGESGQLSLRGGFNKRLLRYPQPYVHPGASYDRWEPVPVPGAGPGETPELPEPPGGSKEVQHRCNQRLVLDLIAAIEEDREPLSSGERARAALEMIQAVAAAHVAGGRVTLPLAERRHPYADFPV